MSTAVGLVPVEGRGSLPFALLHGESLVATASWALAEAGVELLDFTTSWDEVRACEAALVVHDPLCPATPVPFLVEAVEAATSGGCVVVGVRPVTDTVAPVAGGVLGPPVDRSGLVSVASPVVLPAEVVASLPDWPRPLDAPSRLVAALGRSAEVMLLEAPPAARRVVDESDLVLLHALT